MSNYRNAFRTALILNVLLAGGLAFVWWHFHPAGTRGQPFTPPGTAAPGSETGAAEATTAPPAESPLVPVQLTPERLQSIGVKTEAVESKEAFDEIRTVGNVAVDERRLAYVQLRFAGWIRKVFVDATYDFVRKGQPLFTVYSPDLVTTEQEYLLAKKNTNLLAASTVPGVASGAASLLGAADERLKLWEIPEREIRRLETTGEVRDELEIDSPVSGYIMARNALPNAYVQPETQLYTVADLSTVWVDAAIFQNQVGQLKVGDAATVTVDAYPGRAFQGRVDLVYPEVDMATRTAKARFVFPNPGLKLTPGMFVNVEAKIPLGRQLVIPASGVFRSGTREIAFVDRGGGYFEPRDIELGPSAGEEFVVLKGLKAGERIVSSANFLIDSESNLQAAMGSFTPPPPGAGGAAAINAPSAQATVEFTTIPSPPRKGDNTLQVKLTDASGAPVTGAEVTVTFFMPAMPAMGMAAMRAASTLSDKGGGLYEGSLKLEGGGTWQVAVVAQENGQTVASKQLTVNVEGGM
jgi:membrane fusion protein, copper/silver efflux system